MRIKPLLEYVKINIKIEMVDLTKQIKSTALYWKRIKYGTASAAVKRYNHSDEYFLFYTMLSGQLLLLLQVSI